MAKVLCFLFSRPCRPPAARVAEASAKPASRRPPVSAAMTSAPAAMVPVRRLRPASLGWKVWVLVWRGAETSVAPSATTWVAARVAASGAEILRLAGRGVACASILASGT